MKFKASSAVRRTNPVASGGRGLKIAGMIRRPVLPMDHFPVKANTGGNCWVNFPVQQVCEPDKVIHVPQRSDNIVKVRHKQVLLWVRHREDKLYIDRVPEARGYSKGLDLFRVDIEQVPLLL